MLNLPQKTNQRGQALLIILLVLAVSLTLVLSTASRSVTDIQSTTLEESSLRAFNAAEAGVEKALIDSTIQTTTGGFSQNDSKYTTDTIYSQSSDGGRTFVHPQKIYAGESDSFWFMSHDGDGNLISCSAGDCYRGASFWICFGDSDVTYASPDLMPAIEISVYYDETHTALTTGDFSNVHVSRIFYDSTSSRSTPDNNFMLAGNCNFSIDGQSLRYATQNINMNSDMGIPIACLSAGDCLLMTRVKAYYNTDTAIPVGIRVGGAPTLPAQGLQIESTGTAGDASRKINIKQTFPESPFMFDNAIYSNGGLIKN